MFVDPNSHSNKTWICDHHQSPQKTLRLHNGTVAIDDKLFETIKMLNYKLGIHTSNSCQEMPNGYAWIQFKDYTYFNRLKRQIKHIDEYRKFLH